MHEALDSGVLLDRETNDDTVFTIHMDLSAMEPPPDTVNLDGTTLELSFKVKTEPKPPPEPDPDPDPPTNTIPPRPANSKWQPDTSHASFTDMGKRFKEWLSNDEISRAGAVYGPGPVYSEYDDFNVRKIQSLMGNTVDPVGEAFFGPKQWERLFTEDRPSKSTLPAELRGQLPPQLDTGDPDPTPQLPDLPDEDRFEPGVSHASFTDMGERFKVWLERDEISHDGDGYQPGPVYSEYDDFNVRKIQALMGNPADPAGRAYFGPKQWERLFAEGRPAGARLPRELRGRIPPQLDTDPPPPPPDEIPLLPASSLFQPGDRHSSFTDMGERFKAWLRSDEIHKAGSVYTPGPNYSVYDDRNVRAVQYLMGDTPDEAGREFLGPKQWEFLFTQDRPDRNLPDWLKPGGGGGSGGGGGRDVPTDGREITLRYKVSGDWAAGYHTGVDFGDRGSDDIASVGAGTVVDVGRAGDWGLRVVIRHGNGRYSHYCHLRRIDVRRGQRINARGVRVGLMGETGRTFGKHLHYQESVGGYGYWDHVRPNMLGVGGY